MCLQTERAATSQTSFWETGRSELSAQKNNQRRPSESISARRLGKQKPNASLDHRHKLRPFQNKSNFLQFLFRTLFLLFISFQLIDAEALACCSF